MRLHVVRLDFEGSVPWFVIRGSERSYRHICQVCVSETPLSQWEEEVLQEDPCQCCSFVSYPQKILIIKKKIFTGVASLWENKRRMFKKLKMIS